MRMGTRHKKLVDEPILLHIRIADDLVINLDNKWANFPNSIGPQVFIKVCRRPCFDLFRGVVLRRENMNNELLSPQLARVHMSA